MIRVSWTSQKITIEQPTLPWSQCSAALETPEAGVLASSSYGGWLLLPQSHSATLCCLLLSVDLLIRFFFPVFLCHKTKFQRETWETLFFLHRIKGPQQIPNLINIFNNSDNKLTATALEALCHLVKLLSKTAINQRRNARVVAHVCCLFQCETLIALPTAHLDWILF